MNNEVTKSFAKSILEYNTDNIMELGEIGLDCLLDDSILKEIPFIKTIYGITKTGFAIREKHMFNKTIQFIQYINNLGKGNDKFEEYKKELKLNNEKCLKELERVLILIDRYIEVGKVNILARLFLNYIESNISWDDFAELSIILDNIFIKDLKELEKIYSSRYITMNQIFDKLSFRRIKNQNLIEEIQSTIREQNGSISHYFNEFDYQINELGIKLYKYGVENTNN